MGWGRELPMRMFGCPKGLLGRLGGVIMSRVNRHAASQVIELLDVQTSDKVLEVGFGPGVGIQVLLEHITSGSVAGIDQSQEMVRQAAARNATALRNAKADLRYGSVERLPFADETFDKVFAINSMQVWRDAGAGLREIRRVLKHGGNVALCFTVNSGRSQGRVRELIDMVQFAQTRLVEERKLFCAIARKP
jgi:ubiquinone/menaquinone biosynthesis C-methylase UbiE